MLSKPHDWFECGVMCVQAGVGHIHLLCLLGCPDDPVRHLLLA